MDQKFNENINEQRARLKKLQKKGALLGNTRLFVAIVGVVFVIFLILNWFSALYLSLLIVALGGFVFLSAIHSDVSSEINYALGIIEVNSQYLDRLSGEWKSFKDKGGEFADYNHNFTHDLDVFGDKSLFQFINVTKTPYGRMKLKNDLSAPNYSLEEIEARQEAVAELSKNQKLSHDFQYYGKNIKYNSDLPKVVDYVKNKQEFLRLDWLRHILCPLPFINILLCIIFVGIGGGVFRLAAAGLMVMQLLLWSGFSLKTLGYLSSSERIHYSLSDYSALYGILEKYEVNAKLLAKIRLQLMDSQLSAAVATKQLGRILQRIQMRTSGILYIILNLLFLWDISCSISLSKWTKKYGKHIEQWFLSLGEFESLLSFSVLGSVVSGVSMAKMSKAPHVFSAEKLGHPLLSNDIRVTNDFTLTKNINIVSGSNMSGKTTFLRTVGTNLLLAKNGSFVCAQAMTFSNMELVSSMRVSDDLMDGISTFYSELKKIKRVLEIAKTASETMFLIDEIFRGTNSADRTAGARAVIKKLKSLNAFGFLTTHDLALCENFDGTETDNYNFSECYQNGQLHFDYKIHDGVARTTNGEYLMRLIGIM